MIHEKMNVSLGMSQVDTMGCDKTNSVCSVRRLSNRNKSTSVMLRLVRKLNQNSIIAGGNIDLIVGTSHIKGSHSERPFHIATSVLDWNRKQQTRTQVRCEAGIVTSSRVLLLFCRGTSRSHTDTMQSLTRTHTHTHTHTHTTASPTTAPSFRFVYQ